MALYGNRKKRFDKLLEGYEPRTYYDANGNEKTKLVYVSDYYQPNITEKQFTARKIINIALFIAAGALQIFAGVQNVGVNMMIVGAEFQGLGIVASIITAIYLGSYTIAHYKMEKQSYRNAHTKFKTMSCITAAILAAVFILFIVLNCIDGWSSGFMSVLITICYIIAAGCFFVMFILEHKTEYTILGPDNF